MTRPRERHCRNGTRRILIIRLGALGDVVNTIPVVRPLREKFPDAYIAWLVEDASADILRAVPGIDEVIVFQRRRWQREIGSLALTLDSVREGWRFFRGVPGKRFDTVLDFQANFKSGMFSFLTRAPERYGFSWWDCRELNWLFNNRRIRLRGGTMHRVERALALTAGLAGPCEYSRPEIEADKADADFAEGFMSTLDLPGPKVALHPGTSKFGEFKRWPVDSFIELGDALVRRFDANVIVTWGPAERDLAESIVNGMSETARLSPRTASLRSLVELIRRCDLFVAGDTGPLHVAAMLGVPVVGIYGPKDPRIYGPYGPETRVVREHVPCSPCEKRRCRDPKCITAIAPARVLRAAEDLLATRA